MRSLSIQVQPSRSRGIDIDHITQELTSIAALDDLVAHHRFDHGVDKIPYYNFTFGTEHAGELWSEIRDRLYGHESLGRHMKAASMVMCSMEDGWDDYLLLFHFDPTLELDDEEEL